MLPDLLVLGSTARPAAVSRTSGPLLRSGGGAQKLHPVVHNRAEGNADPAQLVHKRVVASDRRPFLAILHRHVHRSRATVRDGDRSSQVPGDRVSVLILLHVHRRSGRRSGHYSRREDALRRQPRHACFRLNPEATTVP